MKGNGIAVQSSCWYLKRATLDFIVVNLKSERRVLNLNQVQPFGDQRTRNGQKPDSQYRSELLN